MRPDDSEQLRKIFDRTGGDCHLCHKPMVFEQYGKRTGWVKDHSLPVSRGGTDHPNNLFAAHTVCNLRKGDRSSEEFRREIGVSGLPPSTEERKERAAGAFVLVVVGLAFFLLVSWFGARDPRGKGGSASS